MFATTSLQQWDLLLMSASCGTLMMCVLHTATTAEAGAAAAAAAAAECQTI
jgi:hypothetical protein